MADDPPKETLVGSGSFRVDPSRAIEVLRKFQFDQPALFARGLLRAAALGGAKRFSLKSLQSLRFVSLGMPSGIEVRFDGRPFDAATVHDPFRCLFEETGPDRRRQSELARAMLTLQALEPLELSLKSPEQPSGGDTVVRAVWKRVPESLYAVGGVVRENGPACPVDVTVEGFEDQGAGLSKFSMMPYLGREPSSPWFRAFEGGGRRGRVEAPDRPAVANSRLEFYQAGVLVEILRMDPPGPAQVDAFIDDQGLTLSLSGNSLVRDATFDAAMAELGAQERLLLAEVAEEQGDRMVETGRLLAQPKLAAAWAATLEGSLTSSKGAGDGAAVYQDACRTRWLRHCCRSLTDFDKDSAQPQQALLWSVPLFFGRELEPLSLKDVWEERRRVGAVPFCRDVEETRRHVWVLWLSSSMDKAALPAALKTALTEAA